MGALSESCAPLACARAKAEVSVIRLPIAPDERFGAVDVPALCEQLGDVGFLHQSGGDTIVNICSIKCKREVHWLQNSGHSLVRNRIRNLLLSVISGRTMPQHTKGAEDRRVEKTLKLLREALVPLIAQKHYDSIVVKEILDRANVGRSTFCTHFRDKDDLLVSGMYDMLGEVPPPTRTSG